MVRQHICLLVCGAQTHTHTFTCSYPFGGQLKCNLSNLSHDLTIAIALSERGGCADLPAATCSSFRKCPAVLLIPALIHESLQPSPTTASPLGAV